MKQIAPYIFPILAVFFVVWISIMWSLRQQERQRDREMNPCQQYSETAISQVPAKCLQYFRGYNVIEVAE